MNRREYLERKAREDQEATAHVFQEFINTFQDVPATSKTFIKTGVLFTDNNPENTVEGQIYQPKPILKNPLLMQNVLECARLVKDTKIDKNKKYDKTKSNLETLKEELKQRHSEKDERDRIKEQIISAPPAISYFDGGDPNSTNLFVANLNTSITEAVLMEEFGLFGPLASVKIMWPRGDDKFKHANTNYGFVAYMSRVDAERALRHMRPRTDMRVGWGKSVELPSHPIYIPQELLRLYLPPPYTGLPFNAQSNSNETIKDLDENIDEILYDSVVKVTIPLNRKIVALANRMVEFVVKEGPLFEAVIMNREMDNPEFNFLFDNKSPTHVYYRWRLFSVLQGEPTKHWSLKPFRMFEGGSIWLPPRLVNYSDGMPEHLVKFKIDGSKLTDNQCERLIEVIRNLTLAKSSILEAMMFCMDYVAAINDIFDILVDSLCNKSTKPPDKVSRMYLLSDVLSNCVAKNISVCNVERDMDKIIRHLQLCFDNINQDNDRQIYSKRILRVLQQFSIIGIISDDVLKNTETYFKKSFPVVSDEGGNSSSDEPLDGAALLKRSLKVNKAENCMTPAALKAKQTNAIPKEYFVFSKWDTIDPEEVEAQAMSTSKMSYMDSNGLNLSDENDSHLIYDKTKKRTVDKLLSDNERNEYSLKKKNKKKKRRSKQ
ncbi:U2 snRNP-associated SURP motif-containing protein-like [Sitophilus oryzae]|uniref:U2 snRNP-associated SURP motif-containing protein-like n=1 Tax=Sitophilus oryzae TaxID=7048 RepID=A0A6J2Y2K3_SITOR|nr:U2 snRNP-associated SURP motif-containing protein-like [Sitophilus oryzae]